jgi:23S rRNA (cytosine1962-C5)-methyltransferase
MRVAKNGPLRIVVENGVRYFADPQSGRNPAGITTSARRRFIASLAKGERVLDAYCYSGGFSILAAARAREVAGLIHPNRARSLIEAARANDVASICTLQENRRVGTLERLAVEKGSSTSSLRSATFAPSRKDVRSARALSQVLPRLPLRSLRRMVS